MLIFESLGPSGVGKSTILKTAAASANDLWLTARQVEAGIGKPTPELTREALDTYSVSGFADRYLGIIATSRMLPSQKVTCAMIFRRSIADELHLLESGIPTPVVHDELVLHRATSVLPYAADFEGDARWFFNSVNLPDGAVIFRGAVDMIFDRMVGRGPPVNVYYGLDESGVKEIIQRSLEICDIAKEMLSARGVPVKVIDAGNDVNANANLLNTWIAETAGTVSPRRLAFCP